MIFILLALSLTPVSSMYFDTCDRTTEFLLTGFRGHDLLNDLNPLTIKAIKIPSQQPKKENAKIPKSVLRVGDFLCSLLRTEYEKKQILVADLPAPQALDGLKDQICLYVKGAYPFELPLPASQDPFEWWKCLDEDVTRKAVVQPLAVSTHSFKNIYKHSSLHW